MPNNLAVFVLENVVDACSVWNLLSARVLYSAAIRLESQLMCTSFVMYECLQKPRSQYSPEDEELMRRLREANRLGNITKVDLSLEDLVEKEILESRKRLGLGELSSLAFAKNSKKALLTDDQGARKFATQIIEPHRVQTIPHLFGHLVYNFVLLDSDKESIISEHESFNRPLAKYFEEMFNEGLRCRLMLPREVK